MSEINLDRTSGHQTAAEIDTNTEHSVPPSHAKLASAARQLGLTVAVKPQRRCLKIKSKKNDSKKCNKTMIK